jgi:membrane protein required for colicin V production
MTLDFITITLAFLLFVRGYKKGLIIAVCSVIAILLGISCALALSAKLSVYLFEKGFASSSFAPLISYAILFIGVVWLVRLLAKFIEKATSAALLGWVNKSIGGILYISIGMIIYSSVLWMCNSAHILSQETIVSSMSYKYISPIAPWVFDHIGNIIPFVKNTFADMSHFFDGVNKQLPEHVGAPR